jgi:hypothetical protein
MNHFKWRVKLSHLTLLLIVNKWHLGIYEILFCMRPLCNIYKSIFIGNLCSFPLILQRDIVPLILQRDIVSINRLTLMLKIIGQCVADKNKDVSCEGLDMQFHQYHCSSYRTSCYTSDNVHLDHHSSRYSVYREKISQQSNNKTLHKRTPLTPVFDRNMSSHLI